MQTKDISKKYYNIAEDVRRYPEAWLYIITGGRATGKTYGTLLDCYLQNHRRDFIFIKRTMEDVDLLCSGTGSVQAGAKDFGVNLSPFAAINRDIGSHVNAFSIKKGIAGFWDTVEEEDGKQHATGKPVGTIFALNGVTKYKGFELASSKPEQWIIFDEFIPNIYDRVNRNEGLQLLDFYKTVSRDRVQRGLAEVKLICLANATNIANPLFDTLEITDTVADMVSSGRHEYYDNDRQIFIHLLEDNSDLQEPERATGLYKAMSQTPWGMMTYNNQFAYNDFSSVRRSALKGYACVTAYHYKHETVYVYYNDGRYYLTSSRNINIDHIYDLNRENGQKAFFNDWVITLRTACINDLVYFKKYSYYDLIISYKKIFKL